MDGPEPSARLAEAAIPRRIAVVGSYTIVTFRGWLIEEMVSRGHTVFACAPELNEADRARLAKAGATYQRIGLERTGLNPFQDIKHITDLAALFRRLNVEIVIAHTTKAMILGCLAARLAGVGKTFAIVEGLGYAFTPGPERKRRLVRSVLSPAMKAALAVCDGVFVLNSDDRTYLIGLGILSPKQHVEKIAGTGLDLDHYAYVPLTSGPPRFLLIARMIRDKGIVEYAGAARIVKAKHPEARFRLIGPIDDHPGAITREQIAAWEAMGVIEYLGVTEDVRPYLADCTAYVLPSYREGMPRTVMEAMAIGRPVIATDVPGCRDLVEEGVTGFLVPPRDVEALAKAMERMIEDPRGGARRGRSARRHAESVFSAAAVNSTILAALYNLTSQQISPT